MLGNMMLRAVTHTVRLSLVVHRCCQCPVLHTCRWLHSNPELWAGHNKWSKVKDIKIPKDAARARVMAKYSLMIRIAVREGGSNPEFNINLAQILEQCRNKNLPKASIEGAIKGAKSKPGLQHLYEATGPGGCTLLIEVLTDNNTRSHQEIKRIMTKHGGALCEGARRNFDRKGVVAASRDEITSEKALELAIEAGAEDVQETEDEEERPVLQAQLETASSLLETLHDCPDVVRVWDNIQAQS
ncbi:translational activator of cytochrome c oxidase 1 isoform X2 [Triplophysa dalaica]|uniref:translational activator of cytochrome c oxidase 1 isoform X2 n=1 Tax=Triplophysa dalaica TaxID=1582913 RepID=UPI0024DFE795|nr:translational activator of cytochrome c oxidase 1 isoform X2 [Triplophysa dalaica]